MKYIKYLRRGYYPTPSIYKTQKQTQVGFKPIPDKIQYYEEIELPKQESDENDEPDKEGIDLVDK